jgi:hypothetical protein
MVGAVWGGAIPQGKMLKYYESMSKLYGKNVEKIVLENGSIRGLTHDTVIRKELIKDIKIPKELHVMEDHYIRKHIESKGYKWISTINPFCYHYKKYIRPKSLLDSYYGWKLGVYNKKKYFKHLLFSPFKIFYLLLSTKDFSLVIYEALKEYLFIKGLFKALKEEIF